MHVCFIAAFSCYCFTTNATYRLVQVKWFTSHLVWIRSAPTLQLSRSALKPIPSLFLFRQISTLSLVPLATPHGALMLHSVVLQGQTNKHANGNWLIIDLLIILTGLGASLLPRYSGEIKLSCACTIRSDHCCFITSFLSLIYLQVCRMHTHQHDLLAHPAQAAEGGMMTPSCFNSKHPVNISRKFTDYIFNLPCVG